MTGCRSGREGQVVYVDVRKAWEAYMTTWETCTYGVHKWSLDMTAREFLLMAVASEWPNAWE